MRTKKQRIIWATIGVFILLAVIYAVSAANSFKRDSAHALARAELSARVHTGELERDFQQGIAVAEALEEVVIDGQGQVPRFREVAET